MTYFKVEQDFTRMGFRVERLGPKDINTGKVNGRPEYVEVLDDDTVFRNGKGRVKGEEGAAVFDRPHLLSSRRAVLHLTESESRTLEREKKVSKDIRCPGVFQEVLQGLYRRALEQAGLREKGKRSLWERLEAAVTRGTTEVF